MGLFSKTKDSNIICLCKRIDKDTIVNAIKNGADSYEKVKEVTGASKGICKGLRCKHAIESLLSETLNNN
ncbi:MAG: (2Fe-2S)-binding protein [Sarcina sp.]